MLCPLKFSHYEFEGGRECIGSECGMFKRCNADYEITAVEFDALDEHAQALERENEELRKLCGANDGLAVENDVSATSVDANAGNADTREELEADVHDLFWGDNLQRYARQKGYLDGSGIDVNESITTTNHEGHVTATTVMHLLDRQKAITERHWMEIVGASANANVELKRQIDEWQARVDELTEHLEAAHAKNRSLKAHIAKMQEGRHGWHVKSAELQKQVDELIAENAKLSSELTAARNAHAQAEHEAVILREKLGRMLDNAHEITRIGGDC